MVTERFDWLEVDKAKPKPAPDDPREQFDARSYLLNAQQAYRRGAYEFALKHFGRALREDHMLWDAWWGQVGCLHELGELDEARVWANKALERFPESPEILSAKALVSAKTGDMTDALTYSDRAIAKKDPGPLVWLQRGLVLLYSGPGSRHESCFRKALESAVKDSFTASRVGMGYLAHGDLMRAKTYLARAVDEEEENALAWYHLGECCERLYAFGRAQTSYERSLALKPEFKDKVLDAMARIARRSFWSRLADRWRGWWQEGE